MKTFKCQFSVPIIILLILASSILIGQVLENEQEWQKQTQTPTRAIDFSKMFQEEETTRQDFEDIKRKRESELRQKILEAAALEKAIDPETYIVGPGDIFTFNIWGAMEMSLPVVVSPEGSLPIPSVGEIDIREMTLTEAKKTVLDAAKPFYEKSDISLTLTTLRSFRVHVVGEVEYPGTYLANPTERISDMVFAAGGATDWANKVAIQLRQLNGDTIVFNLSLFELNGDLIQDVFVHGGDIVYVPPIDLSSSKVHVEGDFKVGGLYQIVEKESVHEFLQRIGAFTKNTNPLDVVIVRKTDQDIRTIKPYLDGDATQQILLDGDRILIPSEFVYVKGAVQFPGTYPYIASLKAKDYAGMAGGNNYSGTINRVKVYHTLSGKTKKGPDTPVAPGDVVDLPKSMTEEMTKWGSIFSVIISSILAARAVGLI